MSRARTTGFAFPPILAGISLCLVVLCAGAAVNTGTDVDAGLPYWEVVEGGVSIRLVQRLPDQTRGFFAARGFSEADAERIAQSCVFQTVFRNVSTAPAESVIEYDLRQWVVRTAGVKRKVKTREDWQQEWTLRNAPQTARIAFEWALLPTRHRYLSGDYNWGMTLFDLKPGSVFDLDVVWREDGKDRAQHLKGVRCAPDIPFAPAAP